MGKKKLPKGAEVSFSETEEGKSIDLFAKKWYSLPFGKKTGEIDHEKLWWDLHAYSDQGGVYVNWMSAGRTFFNNKPWVYRTRNIQSTNAPATRQAIEFIRKSTAVADDPTAIGSLVPDHLRPQHNHNGGGEKRTQQQNS